ncbi:MAG: TetR/AcrR family transcriptional regulator [Planctomycetota bacterium]
MALNILTQEGYLGLTMDKLAQATGFAKGTLYLHFKNKEDLICALLGQFQQRRVELFQRVAGFRKVPTVRGSRPSVSQLSCSS